MGFDSGEGFTGLGGGGGGGSVTLAYTQIAFGSPSNAVTSSPDLTYDETAGFSVGFSGFPAIYATNISGHVFAPYVAIGDVSYNANNTFLAIDDLYSQAVISGLTNGAGSYGLMSIFDGGAAQVAFGDWSNVISYGLMRFKFADPYPILTITGGGTFFSVDGNTAVYQLGDINGTLNSTWLDIDDYNAFTTINTIGASIGATNNVDSDVTASFELGTISIPLASTSHNFLNGAFEELIDSDGNVAVSGVAYHNAPSPFSFPYVESISAWYGADTVSNAVFSVTQEPLTGSPNIYGSVVDFSNNTGTFSITSEALNANFKLNGNKLSIEDSTSTSILGNTGTGSVANNTNVTVNDASNIVYLNGLDYGNAPIAFFDGFGEIVLGDSSDIFNNGQFELLFDTRVRAFITDNYSTYFIIDPTSNMYGIGDGVNSSPSNLGNQLLILDASNQVSLGDVNHVTNGLILQIDNTGLVSSLGDVNNANNGQTVITDNANNYSSIGDINHIHQGTYIVSDDEAAINILSNGIAFSTMQEYTNGSSVPNVTIQNGVRGLYYDPASPVSAATITLPSASIDGQEVIIFFGGTIKSGAVVTTLTISPNAGQTLVNHITTPTATAAQRIFLKYRESTSQWYVF